MIPRVPTEANLTHTTDVSAGQQRVVALQEAVRFHIETAGSDSEMVVETAEKFHAFLAAGEGTDATGEGQ